MSVKVPFCSGAESKRGGEMVNGISAFLKVEDGAAVLDWVLLAASLTTLVVVALGTATGVLVPQRAMARRSPPPGVVMQQGQTNPGS